MVHTWRIIIAGCPKSVNLETSNYIVRLKIVTVILFKEEIKGQMEMTGRETSAEKRVEARRKKR